ncbi:E3 ubiquitin-protein ligase RNF149 isoform X3 [Alligator mississippiensis]|uniref:E3 ubiquitin-protein ligase RNF149 isoform X3 n=1 Tax=Alligator mississippiensis TaxID=8496 RepID=UPI0009070027|nr:E3 ubiquitin-protein ligase RNF149 isoform X3 [Alligator mississippiensis]
MLRRARLTLVAAALLALGGGPGAGCARALEWYTAWVSTAYTEPRSNRTVRGNGESGRYGDSSPKAGAQGLVGIPRGAAASARRLEGCAAGTDYDVPQPPRPAAALEPPWIALVARGGCTFKDKVTNAARRRAAAVVIYNEPRFGNATVSMSHLGTGNTVVIMVGYPKGIEILEPVRRGIPVKMTIGVGTRHVQEFISGQSVVFVAIAFITMMLISLAWLIFYYIQRFLYTGSQFGNQGYRKETKKVISQLQLHTVKRGDKGLDVDAENCAVCIENYKPKDTVRILPCKHIFHRICIDPWLVDHRTCPMCKLDVIKALGYWPGWLLFTYFILKGDPEDAFEVPIPESISGSVSLGSLSIALQEDDRNEVSDLSASSTNESVLQCNSLKEDAGETTALLERFSAANFDVCRLEIPLVSHRHPAPP